MNDKATIGVSSESDRILDQYLLAAALSGDRPSWDRLVQRWQSKLLRHAWRVLGDADLARDVVQEAWVQILRGVARLQDLVAFPAWAFRIVTRCCLRAQRRAGRDQCVADQLVSASELETPVAANGEFAAELALVRAAIQSLPAAQRSALGLFYLEDLSVAEVAVALDVPVGTVKTRLMHARRKLRAQLGEVTDE